MDTEVFLLTIANVALGVVVGLCLVGLLLALAKEIVGRLRRRLSVFTELDRDMDRLFGAPQPRK